MSDQLWFTSEHSLIFSASESCLPVCMQKCAGPIVLTSTARPPSGPLQTKFEFRRSLGWNKVVKTVSLYLESQ